MAEPVNERPATPPASLPWTERPSPGRLTPPLLFPNLRFGAGPELTLGGRDGSSVGLRLEVYGTKPLWMLQTTAWNLPIPILFLPKFEGSVGTGRQSAGAGVMVHAILPDLISLYLNPMFHLNHAGGELSPSADLRIGAQVMVCGDPLILGSIEYGPPIPPLGTDGHTVFAGVRFRL